MKTDENFDSVRPFGFRAPRIPADFSFVLEVIPSGERYDAVCTDISEDGLAAEVPASLAPKTQVTMRILLPGSTEPLLVRGSVENFRGTRCGLNFLFTSPEELKQVRAFIRSIS